MKKDKIKKRPAARYENQYILVRVSGAGPLFYENLSALIAFAASAFFRIAIASIANNDFVERAIFSVAVEHAVGHFAADRVVDLVHNNNLLPLL